MLRRTSYSPRRPTGEADDGRSARWPSSHDETAVILNSEITIGNILTILSVLISAAALAYNWRKDRQLRRTEYADRIRHGASEVAAKLERWPLLVGQFFDDVQPLVHDVDRLHGDEQARREARMTLDRGLFERRALASARIAEERIESAWVDLYGYDPRIYELFLGAVSRIKAIDERYFAQLRDLVRTDATTDSLQARVADLAQAYERETAPIIAAFRREVLKLVQADDAAILARAVPLSDASPPSAGRDLP
jgi:hypothetical protein